jgi:DNA-binding transcriptional LysR family regulator
MDHPPFSQLQAFSSVARAGNFSAAARELAVSQSAVSQAVRQLEEQLDVVLVARIRLSDPFRFRFRFLVVGAPAYPKKHGIPESPEEDNSDPKPRRGL